MTKKEKDARRADAIKYLREMIHAGDTIFTVLTHVSSNGMSRNIKVIAYDARQKGHAYGIRNISWVVADALGLSVKNDAVKIGGCGMDMGYSIVYSLGSVLFGNGEEVAKLGYHTGRNGDKGAETDGGYCLRHAWL